MVRMALYAISTPGDRREGRDTADARGHRMSQPQRFVLTLRPDPWGRRTVEDAATSTLDGLLTLVDHQASTGYDVHMGRILDAICEAIETSNKTRYRIAKETGISQAQLSRVMSGERGLSIDALERLADYLELEIIIRSRHRRKRG